MKKSISLKFDVLLLNIFYRAIYSYDTYDRVNSQTYYVEGANRQINTKFLRSQISRITAKTFGKIVGYNLGYSCLGSAVSGFIESWQLYRQRYTKNLQKVPVTFIV